MYEFVGDKIEIPALRTISNHLIAEASGAYGVMPRGELRDAVYLAARNEILRENTEPGRSFDINDINQLVATGQYGENILNAAAERALSSREYTSRILKAYRAENENRRA